MRQLKDTIKQRIKIILGADNVVFRSFDYCESGLYCICLEILDNDFEISYNTLEQLSNLFDTKLIDIGSYGGYYGEHEIELRINDANCDDLL